MIPRRIIRSVPTDTTEQVEAWFVRAADLHPGWEMVTHRDPIEPWRFPITAPFWPRCQNGAQLAGLIRLEALYSEGGIWLDSDVELFRPLDSLLHCSAFAAWEDANVVPDAVLGAVPQHPAIGACLVDACRRIATDDGDWRTGNGAWSTGPGVTTSILPGRDDVLLLPPGSFFPVHYSEKALCAAYTPEPWTFAIHHWAASWLPGGADVFS